MVVLVARAAAFKLIQPVPPKSVVYCTRYFCPTTALQASVSRPATIVAVWRTGRRG